MTTKTTLAIAMAASVLAGGAQAALPAPGEQPAAAPLLTLDAYGRLLGLAPSDELLNREEMEKMAGPTTNNNGNCLGNCVPQ